MVWLWLTLRIFGILLLVLLGLFVVLLFVPVQLEVKWDHNKGYAEGKFLFLKYRYDLDFLNKKDKPEKEATALEPETETKASHISEAPPVKATLKEPEILIQDSEQTRFKAPKAPRARRPFKMLKAFKGPKLPKIRPLKIPTPSKLVLKLTKLRVKLHDYLEIFREGKPVLFRLLKKVKIKKARTRLHYSVDSPVHNAQLLGLLWASEANVYGFLRRHFKKVKHHDFDLKSDFTGNHLDVGLDYKVSIRPIDLVTVALKSLTELKTLRKLLANKPATA